jgi:preprotein translocase subunit SecA
VQLALVAHRVLARDADYTVAGESLQIGEEVLRRHAQDATALRLLRLLVELKEKCRLSATRETLARMALPRFFRGYLRLGGLATDIRGLGAELWSVYRLRPARIDTQAAGLQVRLSDRMFQNRERMTREILARVKELRERGAPVMLVTRNHQACSFWAKTLKESGIECAGLMGTQDDAEAAAFAAASAAGNVTVAVHVAARGVSTVPSAESDETGGLRIIEVQLLPTPRHERALIARSIPAGATGSIQRILALDDDAIAGYVPAWWRRHRLPFLRGTMLRFCQWRIAREQAHMRREQLRVEDLLGDLMAFSGRGD